MLELERQARKPGFTTVLALSALLGGPAAALAQNAGSLGNAARTSVTGATDTALRGEARRPATVRPLEQKRRPSGAEQLDDVAERQAPEAEEARVKFTVTTIEFVGNTKFAKSDLARLAKPYEHREVSLLELRKLCLKIRDNYRANGYLLARAGVPPQKIKAGRVKIAISEGRFGKIDIKGNHHYPDEFIRHFFSAALEDKVVNRARVERALLLLNQFSDNSVKSVFDIGKEPGTTDVTLRVTDSAPIHPIFDYNNYGNELVGRNRAGIGFLVPSAFAYGDELYLHGTYSFPEDSPPFYQASYMAPVGRRGNRLTGSFLKAETRVGGQFDILDLRGEALVGTIGLTHPIELDSRTTSNFNLVFTFKDVENFIFENQLVSRDRIRELTLGYERNWTRGKGRTVANFSATQGLGNVLDGTKVGDPLSSRPGAAVGNSFTRANPGISHMHEIGEATYLFLRFDGQASSQPLAVPEQFALGGPDSVRGFVQSAFLGDDGASASAEVRWGLFDQELFHLQGVGFLDAGYARIQKPLINEVEERSLVGAGVGVRAAYSNTVSSRIDVGFPVSGREADERSAVLYGQVVSRF